MARKHVGCLICGRIALIKKGENPDLVMELETGYVIIGWHQFYRGYTLFLSKKHVTELHELKSDERFVFMDEMSLVGKAVFKAFSPDKINYEILGNTDPHLHCHIFPRRKTDPRPREPVWVIDKNIRCNEKTKLAPSELENIKKILKRELSKIINRSNSLDNGIGPT